MPQNLELKARVSSLAECRTIARALGAKRVWKRKQVDTYFCVRHGRLKVREFSGGHGELISYRRPDTRGSRVSRFDVIPLARSKPVKSALAQTVGILAIVRKERELYMFRNCRIHLDRVTGLGDFMEFEVLVTRGSRQAVALMKEMKKRFGIRSRGTVAGSYSDFSRFKQLRSTP